jgi:hypothetical protein
MSLALPTTDAERPTELTLDTWHATGLPWSVFWLKDLLVWGTIEPVAAYLLARGRVVVRRDALEAAEAYYSSVDADTPNDKLDPRKIRDWAEVALPPSRSKEPSAPAPFNVSLVRSAADYVKRTYRVVPVPANGEIRWCDLAGYVVAIGPVDTTMGKYGIHDHDFELDVDTATITTQRFT